MKDACIPDERKARIAAAAGKHAELHDYCGVENITAGIAIANIDSEERYRAGNNGRDKFDTTPPCHQKRKLEQIAAHNAKRAAKRERRRAAREAACISTVHESKEGDKGHGQNERIQPSN